MPDNEVEAERAYEEFRKLTDHYQEQPELLDPCSEQLIEQLTSHLNDKNISQVRYHLVFKFLYQLIKVRGFKSINSKFPCSTDRLPFLVDLLAKEDNNDNINWQTRLVLTTWLSIVILTPFDLQKFDAVSENKNQQQEAISEKIYSLLVPTLEVYNTCQHATSYCLAKFFSRPDVLKTEQHLSQFIETTLKELERLIEGTYNHADYKLIGCLRTLIYTFKHVARSEMKTHCDSIIKVLAQLDFKKVNSELVKHLLVKLVQRVGLALLPTKVAPWRYNRGGRVLAKSDAGSNSVPFKPAIENLDLDDKELGGEDEESFCAESLETVLSQLFVAMQDTQTKVRYSASKGVARVTARLSKEKANDVIDEVLGNINSSSPDTAWHSGCLTLAELCKHGLLTEEKLDEAIPIVQSAIVYDKIKANFVIGSHVREAACYTCWALAHTYDSDLLKAHVSSISTSLLNTILFDRELSCRRAASAAFQELIGRQGTDDEIQIEILNLVDYQTIGQRAVCYAQLAPKISSFGKTYWQPFVEHLFDKKIGHWDVQIRKLASQLMGAIVCHVDEKNYVPDFIIPNLISGIEQTSDTNLKHGSILAMSSVVSTSVNLDYEFDDKFIEFYANIAKNCDKQLKSKQSEANFIEAICNLVISASDAKFEVNQVPKEIICCEEISASNSCLSLKQKNLNDTNKSYSTLEHWTEICMSALDKDKIDIRSIGASAVYCLYSHFYRTSKMYQDKILTRLNQSLASMNESSRCGALSSLSMLSKCQSLDCDTMHVIFISLTSYLSKDTKEAKNVMFVDAKACACKAIAEFIYHLDKMKLINMTKFIHDVYFALLAKTSDYSSDRRGDVGATVRRAAIVSLQEMTSNFVFQKFYLPLEEKILVNNETKRDILTHIFSKTLKECFSYIDKTRGDAGLALYKLVALVDELPEAKFAEIKSICAQMKDLFTKFNVTDNFDWQHDSLPVLIHLLPIGQFTHDIWRGLISGIGQVGELGPKKFKDAFLSLAAVENESNWNDNIFNAFHNVINSKDNKQLEVSSLLTIDFLLTEMLIDSIDDKCQQDLVQYCCDCAIRNSDEAKRLYILARIFALMLRFDSKTIQTECLNRCCDLLECSTPTVRSQAAQELHLSLMVNCEKLEESLKLSPEVLKASEELLTNCDWIDAIDSIKPVVDELRAILCAQKSQ